MIDICATREAYERCEINEVEWICSADNVADGMTKLSSCKALHNLMHTRLLTVKVQQWVICSGTGEKDYCMVPSRTGNARVSEARIVTMESTMQMLQNAGMGRLIMHRRDS